MESLDIKLKETLELLKKVKNKFNIEENKKEALELKSKIDSTNFWKNPDLAQETLKRWQNLNKLINPILEFENELNELADLMDLGDQSLALEIDSKIAKIRGEIEEINLHKAVGKYDNHDVILSVYAGAGGTDAQDWAEMLLRMYIRWAEKKNYSVKIIDQSRGEETGIKSSTIEIRGDNLYGILKNEHGVHRLVRLSPFNSDNLRQTSFARVDVIPKIAQTSEVDIDDQELKIDVFRSGGHGGQSVNTTDSAVRITHIPTGISVAIQNERSQIQNKELALTILKSKLLQLLIDQNAQRISEIKGDLKSAEWGNQIRSYVLHPYKQVKDLRSGFISSDPQAILNGDIDSILQSNQ